MPRFWPYRDTSFCPERRKFLRSAFFATAGAAAWLCAPVRGRAGMLFPAVQPETVVLLGRVRTCAEPGRAVAPVYKDGAVLVQGGRIEQVGPRGSFPVPETAVVMDFPGSTILPGIIDAHVHHVATVEQRHKLLASGVTCVGDVGSSLASLDRMQQQGGGDELLTGVYGTGPMFGPPGGYPGRIWPEKYGLPVTDERSGREEAENVLARGASMLKIGFEPGPNPDKPWPMLCLDAAKGIVAAAHEQGVVVRCHVQDLSGLELAIDVGVDCVEHTVLRSARGPVCVGAPGRKMPGAAYATGLHRLADAGIMLVPTLQMAARAAWDGTGALGAVRLFRAAGGVVGLGTDAPMRGVQHGMPLEEMRLLGLAGLDNEAILHAATLGAAKALGQARERGSLEPGKVADLLVLQQDPAMDISVCALPDLIMKEGKIFHAA